jgi:hypothetical protein
LNDPISGDVYCNDITTNTTNQKSGPVSPGPAIFI